MYVHTRERDSRPGFDGVKIKLLLLLLHKWLTIYTRRHFVAQTNR